MPKLKRQPPKLCRKKSNNTAYVTVYGKQIYLGKWGPEAEQNYRAFLAEWATVGDAKITLPGGKERVRVKTLCVVASSLKPLGRRRLCKVNIMKTFLRRTLWDEPTR